MSGELFVKSHPRAANDEQSCAIRDITGQIPPQRDRFLGEVRSDGEQERRGKPQAEAQ
jgi:hypothetical protein